MSIENWLLFIGFVTVELLSVIGFTAWAFWLSNRGIRRDKE